MVLVIIFCFCRFVSELQLLTHYPKETTVYAIYFASLIFRESGLQDIFASG